MICITIWVFRFFYFASQRTQKCNDNCPSFERKMPCGFRILRRNSNHLGHFAYPPGETSLLSSVSTARGSATFVATRHCFFEPKCRPLRCSSSGYRGAHHRVTAGLIIGLPLVGPDGRLGILLESAKFLRFRASSRALWPSRKLLIASVCRLLIRVRSTADRGALIPAKTRHRSDGEFQELHPSASLAERPADATLSQRRAASPSSRRR